MDIEVSIHTHTHGRSIYNVCRDRNYNSLSVGIEMPIHTHTAGQILMYVVIETETASMWT